MGKAKLKPQMLWAIQHDDDPVNAWEFFHNRRTARKELRILHDPKVTRVVRVSVQIIGRG